MRIKISDAAISALQCCGVDCPMDAQEEMLLASWSGNVIEFDLKDASTIWSTLNEFSNSEDAIAEDGTRDKEERKFARKAASALAVVARKVPLA